MGMDVFAAVAAVIAVQQVFDAVHQTPQPMAVNGPFYVVTVGNEQAQQTGQIGRGPLARHIGFGKTDVARLEHLCTQVPVVNVQSRKGRLVGSEHLMVAIGGVQRKGADFEPRQQVDHPRGRLGQAGMRYPGRCRQMA